MANPKTKSTPTASDAGAPEIARLRSLILGNDYEKALQQLHSSEQVKRVADVLPDAIRVRSAQDDRVQKALAPTINDILDVAIRRDPTRLANVIAPVIGPSIRAAVRSALADMVDTLNHLLERSVSFKSLRWRMQAWRSGIPFAQFVLLKTLRYRVEQVLLIHRHTGILLAAESRPDSETRDADLVSAMLSAINDFVRDSFATGANNAELRRIRFGDRILLIEVGTRGILAALVQGEPTAQVVEQLQQTLEQVERIFAKPLTDFSGDRREFAMAAGLLQECLSEQTLQPEQKRKPWFALLLAGAVVAWIGYTSWQVWQRNLAQDLVIEQIQNNTDFVLLSEQRDGNHQFIRLLSRFGAAPPQQTILIPHDANIQVEFSVVPVAMDQQDLVLPYLERRYQLDAQVVLQFRQGVLHVAGPLTQQQLTQIRSDAWLAQITSAIDTHAVTLLPAPDEYSQQIARWHETVAALEQMQIPFQENSAQLDQAGVTQLTRLLEQTRQLQTLAAYLPVRSVQLVLMGFADESGASGINNRLSGQRALEVKRLLLENGVSADLLVHIGAGSLAGERLSAEQKRIVTVKVIYDSKDVAPSPGA